MDKVNRVCGARCSKESVLFLDDNQLNVEAAASLDIQAFLVRGVEEARAVLESTGVVD